MPFAASARVSVGPESFAVVIPARQRLKASTLTSALLPRPTSPSCAVGAPSRIHRLTVDTDVPSSRAASAIFTASISRTVPLALPPH